MRMRWKLVVVLMVVGLGMRVALIGGEVTGRIITEDLVLDPDEILLQPLVITGEDIMVDGRGIVVQGPGKSGDPESFRGTGITIRNAKRVYLRNTNVRGFALGLQVVDAEFCHIEGCDFSDNFNDPDAGWNVDHARGGIRFERVRESVVRGTRARDVWNGMELVDSSTNRIEANDFSHCANICLKLWNADRNRVVGNDLSFGIRIDREKGEVHARDSAGVLVESGSDYNRLENNDVTHGGDGIFIRPLNGWVSTGNVFVGNDCSHANNNAIECWSPGNTFIQNRANHSSYGFWMGGSDRSVVLENEAAYNGLPDGFHNAPEPGFGHGGIVFVNGSSTHSVIEGNHVHHNHGGGIVIRGDLATRGQSWRAYHLLIRNNLLEENRWGVYLQFADLIMVGGNRHRGNSEPDIIDSVTRLIAMPANDSDAPFLEPEIIGPDVVPAGRPVVWRAKVPTPRRGNALWVRWDPAGRESDGMEFERSMEEGFHRLSLSVMDGVSAGIAGLDVYSVAAVDEVGTEGNAGEWTAILEDAGPGTPPVRFRDSRNALLGEYSLEIAPVVYPGFDLAAKFPARPGPAWSLHPDQWISFWLRFENPNLHGFQGPNPILRLQGPEGVITFRPRGPESGKPRNLMNPHDLPYPEARYGWVQIRVPLAGDDTWSVTRAGKPDLAEIRQISLHFDSWGADPFRVWLDALGFVEPASTQ